MTTTLSASDIAGIGMTSQRTRDRLMVRLRAQGISDERVLATMANVPRHLFVDEAMATRAYEDVALPIGEGQTISQPFVVARMTELVLSTPDVKRVLHYCCVRVSAIVHSGTTIFTLCTLMVPGAGRVMDRTIVLSLLLLQPVFLILY